jgi:hypothetical protein
VIYYQEFTTIEVGLRMFMIPIKSIMNISMNISCDISK